VEDNLPEVRLDSVVCIVDAYLAARHPFIGYTTRTQIASADIILINKTDLINSTEAETVEAEVRKHNDRAKMLRTVNCAVDSRLLFGQASGQRTGPLFLPPGERLDSFVWTTRKPLDRAKFDLLVSELPQELVRAKGFVRFSDAGCLFNYVVGRVDFEEFDAEKTELVFIGPDLEKERPQIEQGLDACIDPGKDSK